MTVQLDPQGVQAAGNVRLWWAPALTDPARPTTAELAAGLDLTLIVYDFRPDAVQPRTTAALWLGGHAEYLQPARHSITDLEYDYDPQQTGSTGYGYARLTPGVDGWLVERRGLPAAHPALAGQTVDVYPVTLGARMRAPADEGLLRVRQPVAVRDQPHLDVTLT